MVTPDELIDSTCPKCEVPMFLQEGCYRCGICGYTACEDDSDEDGPRTVDDLPW